MSILPEEIQELGADSKLYLEKKMELLKLELMEKTSEGFSRIVALTIQILIGVFAVLLFCFFLGYLLGEYLHSTAWGFGIVAGVFITAFLILLITGRRKMNRLFADYILQVIQRVNRKRLDDED